MKPPENDATRLSTGAYRHRSWPIWILLLGCLTGTALAVWYTKTSLNVVAEREFKQVCNEIQGKIKDRLRAHEQILRSGAAFMMHSGSAGRVDWRRFTERQKVAQQLPGIQGIGFSLVIPPEKLAQHVEEIRAEGFPDYHVRPTGERAIYTSIIYLEPFADRNLRAFGYDMFSEPVRRAAMEQSRDEDAAVLSGKVLLVQETENDVQTGTLMYVPVYDTNLPCTTRTQRRAALLGWVYSPYRMNDLMRGIMGEWESVIDQQTRLEVFDGTQVTPAALLYDSQSSSTERIGSSALLFNQCQVVSAGRQWTLHFTRTGTMNYGKVWLVLLGGTSISLLLSGLFYNLLNTRFAALEMARKLTTALRQSEAKIHLLLDSAAEAIYGIDVDGNCTFCNNACLRVLGYKHATELLGQNMHWQIHSKYQDGTPFPVEHCLIFKAFHEGKGTHADDEVLWRSDGTCFPAEYWSYPLLRDGLLVGAVVTFFDITERKRAKESLQTATERLTLATRAGGVGIWDYDVVNNKLVWDEQMFRLYEITPDQFGGAYEAWQAGVHPEDRQRGDHEIQLALRGEKNFDTEFRVIWPDGSTRNIHGLAIVQRDAAGRPLRMIGTNWDITVQKQTEAALQAGEARYRAVVEDQTELICRYTADCVLTFVNQAYARYWNRTPSEMVGLNWLTLLPENARSAAREHVAALPVAHAVSTVEHETLTPTGEVRWQQWVDRAIINAEGQITEYQSTGRDITDRRLAEQQLAAETALLQALMNSIPDLIFYKDGAGRYLRCNRAFEAYAGHDMAAILGRTDQELFPAEPAVAYRDNDRLALEADGPRHNEESITYPDGHTALLDTLKTPFYDHDGTIRGIIGISRDITNLRVAERSVMEAHRRLLIAREEERRRIAEELHEVVCQDLIVMQMTMLKLAQKAQQGDYGHSDTMLMAAADTCKALVSEIRNICYALYPPALDNLGLIAAFHGIAETGHQAGVEVKIECGPDVDSLRLPRMVEIALYRVAQEAVANAVRHANPSQIRVTMEHLATGTSLRVTDDGDGFVDTKVASGLGLTVMRERILAVGGSLQINSEPGQTVISAFVPANAPV